MYLFYSHGKRNTKVSIIHSKKYLMMIFIPVNLQLLIVYQKILKRKIV